MNISRDAVTKLVVELCEATEKFKERFPETAQLELENILNAFTFPTEVTPDYLMGVTQTIIHFVNPNAPVEAQMYACFYSSALGRAIASGKVVVK